MPPNTEMLAKLREYCSKHQTKYIGLSKEELTSIKLMNVLKRRAPLTAHEELLEWHLKETGKLEHNGKLGDKPQYRRRETLMKDMIPRYNLEAMMPQEKRVRLPSSKAVVSIPCCDAADCIVSLLTDPRFQDEDLLFFPRRSAGTPS